MDMIGAVRYEMRPDAASAYRVRRENRIAPYLKRQFNFSIRFSFTCANAPRAGKSHGRFSSQFSRMPGTLKALNPAQSP
jgi:hypothetical protein